MTRSIFLGCVASLVLFCVGCGQSGQNISKEAIDKYKNHTPGYTPDQRMSIRQNMMSHKGVTPGGQ
jgi:hypothetical protein